MFSVRLKFSLLLLVAGLFLCLAGCGGSDDAEDLVWNNLWNQDTSGILVPGAVDPGADVCQSLRDNNWFPAETSGNGRSYAWTKGTQATLMLPVSNASAGELIVSGYGLDDSNGPRTLELVLNGFSLGSQVLPKKSGAIVFSVPKLRMREGLNEVRLVVDRVVRPSDARKTTDSRELGVLVDVLQFVPEGQTKGNDPYDETPNGATAGPGRWLVAPLSHLAGASLQFHWSNGVCGKIRIEVAPMPGERACFKADLGGEEFPDGLVELPADLPEGGWLVASGDIVGLSSIDLGRRMNPVNVVLIIIDTLRPDYLGCYGGTQSETPAIDALAADGILFETALCPTPITGPSHTSLFTSRLPSETGIVNNGRGSIPAQMPVLAEILTENGYDAGAAIGIGPLRKTYGFSRGFRNYEARMTDTWILPAKTVINRLEGFRPTMERPSFLWMHLSDPHEPYDAHGLVHRQAEVLLGDQLVATIPTSTYTPTTMTLDLTKGRNKLVVRSEHSFDVRNFSVRPQGNMGVETEPSASHKDGTIEFELTLTADSPGKAKLVLHLADKIGEVESIRERYAREVSHTDTFVGALLDSLKQAGVYDKSLIVFTGDHGEALGSHGFIGHVHTLYDAMVRVPLIIKPPTGSGFKVGSRRMDQATLIDILPTILGRIGVPAMSQARGRDLLIAGAEAADTAIFLETHKPESHQNLYGLRTDDFKIVHNPDEDIWEFYDLKADPDEAQNLAGNGGTEFEKLKQLFLGVMAGLNLAEGDAGDVVVDQQTSEMLRSLGY